MRSGAKRTNQERRLRHRVMVDGLWVFGPGKADLLAAIREGGSLSAAAKSMGMSYMRAWLLVQHMQKTFAEPLITLQRGGKLKGGATLTPTGEQALALYWQMEQEALAATEKTWRAFGALLGGPQRAAGSRTTGKKSGTPP